MKNKIISTMMGLLTVGIFTIPNMVNAKEINLDITNKCEK